MSGNCDILFVHPVCANWRYMLKKDTNMEKVIVAVSLDGNRATDLIDLMESSTLLHQVDLSLL